jgi:beta-N-acetylhexosaminidase
MDTIPTLLTNMTLEEKAGQVLCPIATPYTRDDVFKQIRENKIGCFFIGQGKLDTIQTLTANMQDAAESIPVISCADLVTGLGSRIEGGTLFPWQMAIGAADNEEWAYICGKATARESRLAGIQWTLAPVCDLDINFRCASIYGRAYGEKPEHVLKMSRAFIKGVQEDNLMAAAAKHFPGDGLDDRDPHISLPCNHLTREQWFESYGKVWQEIINDGLYSIMPGHIGLPFIDSEGEPYYNIPATFSSKILQGFLRKELGFSGVIISDAVGMAGAAGVCPGDELAVRSLNAGIDVVLFSNPERDRKAIVQAVQEGKLSEERLNDAVTRVLSLKQKLGLFNDESYTITDDEKKLWNETVANISERSITILRDKNNTIPVSVPKNGKVLTISIQYDDVGMRGVTKNLDIVDEELKQRGFTVTHLHNPKTNEISEEVSKGYDAVFFNINTPPNYGTSRFNMKQFFILHSSFWPKLNNVIFTSFVDPYKIYDMNYVPNMINAYDNNPVSQKEVVKVWLGEKPAQGKNPVKLERYFDIEV